MHPAQAPRDPDSVRIVFQAMASPCEIVLSKDPTVDLQSAARQAIAEVQRIETRYSRYRSDSVVARINAAAGGAAVHCDDETWSLLEFAQALYQSSDGLFDISSGVLRTVWDFKAAQVPSAAALQAVRPLVGWPLVERHNNTVRLPQAGMQIDFGGFGKEYAADRAGAVLEKNGLRHGYVNLGGDIRVIGPRPDGRPWTFGIQDPRDPAKLVASIPLRSGGLATSGDYVRYFEADGKRYCHVLHPHTAMPVTYWRSVSVMAPFAVVAGNCATIAMLKEENGLEFLKNTGMGYLAVNRTGEVFTSTNPHTD